MQDCDEWILETERRICVIESNKLSALIISHYNEWAVHSRNEFLLCEYPWNDFLLCNVLSCSSALNTRVTMKSIINSRRCLCRREVTPWQSQSLPLKSWRTEDRRTRTLITVEPTLPDPMVMCCIIILIVTRPELR